MEVNGSLVERIGRVIFYERWASDDANGDAGHAELHAVMHGLETGSRETHLRPAAFCPYVSVSRVSLLPGVLVGIPGHPDEQLEDDEEEGDFHLHLKGTSLCLRGQGDECIR